ncbi:MAG: hypothetical protein J6T28_04295 [Paludibacteraceae bacterium]|nr:hypothetical protein [Paludibacteraceae bacterium]MBP5482279.1 hypothetical protein [Paludibacteraceae bacterium]
MKKKIFLLLLMAGQFMAGSAKDVIVMKSSDSIKAKILEVTPTEVKYKKMNYLDGPTFIILKSEISKITYGNGDVESFVQKEEKSAVLESTSDIANTGTEADTSTTAANTEANTTVSTSTILPVDSAESVSEEEEPSYPMLDRIKGKYVLGDMVMDKKEYGKFLDANCPIAYEKWRSGSKRVKSGWTLAITGFTCEMISTISFISYAKSERYHARGGYYTYNDGALALGIATLVPAVLLEATAVPLLVTGYVSRRKSIGLYNEQCAPKNSAFELRLNLKGNGLGLTLNF